MKKILYLSFLALTIFSNVFAEGERTEIEGYFSVNGPAMAEARIADRLGYKQRIADYTRRVAELQKHIAEMQKYIADTVQKTFTVSNKKGFIEQYVIPSNSEPRRSILKQELDNYCRTHTC